MRSAMPLSTFISVRPASLKNARWIAAVAALDGVEEFADVGEDPASTDQDAALDGFLHDGSERCPPVARVEHRVRRELHEVPWPAVGLQLVEIAGRDRHTRDRVGKADVEARVIVLGRVLAIDQQAGPLLFRDVLPPAAVEASVMLPVVRENAVQGRACGVRRLRHQSGSGLPGGRCRRPGARP